MISKSDGRWRTASCSTVLPTACRGRDGTWLLQVGERGSCPEWSAFDLPAHAKENTALQLRLQGSAYDAAWLPLQGDRAPLNNRNPQVHIQEQ